jgi:hypothetical protein
MSCIRKLNISLLRVTEDLKNGFISCFPYGPCVAIYCDEHFSRKPWHSAKTQFEYSRENMGRGYRTKTRRPFWREFKRMKRSPHWLGKDEDERKEVMTLNSMPNLMGEQQAVEGILQQVAPVDSPVISVSGTSRQTPYCQRWALVEQHRSFWRVFVGGSTRSKVVGVLLTPPSHQR